MTIHKTKTWQGWWEYDTTSTVSEGGTENGQSVDRKNRSVYQFTGDTPAKRQAVEPHINKDLPPHSIFMSYFSSVITLLMQETNRYYLPPILEHTWQWNFSTTLHHWNWYVYEDGCLLACCTVWFGRSLLKFQRCLLPPSSRCPDDGDSKHFWNISKLLQTI
jgi:hypothetical protein